MSAVGLEQELARQCLELPSIPLAKTAAQALLLALLIHILSDHHADSRLRLTGEMGKKTFHSIAMLLRASLLRAMNAFAATQAPAKGVCRTVSF